MEFFQAKENFWHETASIKITTDAFMGVLQDLGIKYSKTIAKQLKDVKTWMRMFVSIFRLNYF